MKTKLLTLATISSLALSIGTQTFASPLLNKMPRAYQNLINKEIKPIVLRGLNNKYLYDQTYLQRFDTTEPKDLYFSLKDLDNNGVDELIIGTKDGWIYELYTIDKKGKLKQIEDITTVTGISYHEWSGLINDNTIYHGASGSTLAGGYTSINQVSGDKLILKHYCFFGEYHKKTGKSILELRGEDMDKFHTVYFYNKTGEHEEKTSQRTSNPDNKKSLCHFASYSEIKRKLQKLEHPLLPEIKR